MNQDQLFKFTKCAKKFKNFLLLDIRVYDNIYYFPENIFVYVVYLYKNI